MTASAQLRRAASAVASIPRRLVLGLLWVYRSVVSPWTPPTCKYYPSCSSYAVLAITRHGLLRGGWLATHRLVRCNPWSLGGVDDVPPARHHAVVPAS